MDATQHGGLASRLGKGLKVALVAGELLTGASSMASAATDAARTQDTHATAPMLSTFSVVDPAHVRQALAGNRLYQGPVLVTTVEGTLQDGDDPGLLRGHKNGPVYGSDSLLQQAAARGVPIVYLANDPSAVQFLKQNHYPASLVVVAPSHETRWNALQSIHGALPHAPMLNVGNDTGTDPTLYNAMPGQAYLLNTRPDQLTIPPGYKGVVADNFTTAVQQRVLADAEGAQAAAAGLPPPAPGQTVHRPPPMTPNSEPVPGLAHEIVYATGLPFALAGSILSHVIDAGMTHLRPAVPGDWKGFNHFLDVSTGTKAYPNSQVEILIDGDAAFQAMEADIDGARSSVNHSVYSLQSDEAGWEVAQHLAAAGDRHVDVRELYDPLGSASSNGIATDPAVYRYQQQHHVQVLQQATTPAHATHRKLLSIDGKIGYLGGMNDGNEYRSTWHDVQVRITGPAVAGVQKLLVDQLAANGSTVSKADMKKFFPVLSPVPDGSNVRILGHDGEHDVNEKLAYLRAIETTPKGTTINIENPYFTDREVATRLAEAAQRGVRVRIITPLFNTSPAEQSQTRSFYPMWLAAGVEVYEYDGRPFSHGKVATFGGVVSTVGTSNLDRFSLQFNDEANMWTDDARVAASLNERLFDRDIAQSIRITHISANPDHSR